MWRRLLTKVRKRVIYFLAESEFSDITLEEKGGLDDARWFKLSSILDLNFYRDILPIITKAINLLLQKP
jgi:NADH pyrophosphatase NudC (nudix superfamily)